MSIGLPISDVVNVSVNLSPLAAARRPFGGLLIAGDADVIDTLERVRIYSSAAAVASDFGANAPETLAAQLFFSQSPRPNRVFVGRWARTATAGRLNGAPRSANEQLLSVFTAITAGTFSITIDGTPRNLTSINLSSAANLNAVAAAITTALTTWGNCVWNATLDRFEVRSSTTGATSTVAPVAVATPLATALGLTAAQAVQQVPGIIAETPLQATNAFIDRSSDWYALMFAATVQPTDAQHVAVAAAIEAASVARLYALTTQDANVLIASQSSDIASTLRTARYRRTLVQYSGTSLYAVASFLGRALTVDFTGNNTVITMKFKQQPGVMAETLSTSQAVSARNKRANIFVNYENDTTIVQEGVMSDGSFFDEVHGTDWLQYAIQTDAYNLLYTSATKIPQTEAGINQIVACIELTCSQAVFNGLLAPGTWSADGFGKLNRGDYLPKGFYVFSAPLTLQAQADREARRSPTIQVAAKLAGAVHSVNVIINVNR